MTIASAYNCTTCTGTVARHYAPPLVVAGTSVLKKHYLDVMGSASTLVLPLPTCDELVRCANRAEEPTQIVRVCELLP